MSILRIGAMLLVSVAEPCLLLQGTCAEQLKSGFAA
jgi:hypothetical protein